MFEQIIDDMSVRVVYYFYPENNGFVLKRVVQNISF